MEDEEDESDRSSSGLGESDEDEEGEGLDEDEQSGSEDSDDGGGPEAMIKFGVVLTWADLQQYDRENSSRGRSQDDSNCRNRLQVPRVRLASSLGMAYRRHRPRRERLVNG